MANLIQHKRSSTSGVVPTSGSLSYGELAINYADGKLYTKLNNNTVVNLGVTSISGVGIRPSSGVFSGSVTASSFSGNGSSLTGLALGLSVGGLYNYSEDFPVSIGVNEFEIPVRTNYISAPAVFAVDWADNAWNSENAVTSQYVISGVYTGGNQNIAGVKTFTSQIINTAAGQSNTAAGQIYLNGTTSNRIDFNVNGLNTPNIFTRSVGTKINLYPSYATAVGTDFAIGIAGNVGSPSTLWNSVYNSNSRFEWYAGSTNIATLTGSGIFTVGGTTSQINVDNLRLDGNTFSSTNTNGNIIISPTGNGNVGIATTSPSGKLHVDGEIFVDNLKLDSNILGVNSNNTDIQILSSGIESNIFIGPSPPTVVTPGEQGYRVSAQSLYVFDSFGFGESGDIVGEAIRLTWNNGIATLVVNNNSGTGGSAFKAVADSGAAVQGRFQLRGLVTDDYARKINEILFTTTSNNTANIVLTRSGSADSLIIPAQTTWCFVINLSAYNYTDNIGAAWIFKGAIRRNNSGGTTIIGTVSEDSWKEAGMSSASANVVANDTNESLDIRVTGLSSKNIRWTASVDLTQVNN
jgi:hypothetical protein